MSWHYSIEALAVAPALSTRNRVLSLSLLQVRTLPSRVMTSNRARHERIQLPTIIKVRLLGTRRQSGTVPGTVGDLAGDRDGDAPPGVPGPVPDLSGIGDSPPSPSPIWRGRGRSPVPDSHRGVRALSPVVA